MTALNTPTVWSDPVYAGSLNPGSTIDAGITYIDANGNSGNVVGTGWYVDGIFQGLSETFDLTSNHLGKEISFAFSLYDDDGFYEQSANYTAGTVWALNNDPTGAAIISGDAVKGETLTAVTSSIADADGLGSFSYQWLRDGTAISGATNSTYALTSGDVGTAISVRVSYTDGQGTAETLTSSATSSVQNVNDSPTGLASISGTAAEGETLMAVTSSIADADGLGSFSYQWLRDGTAISGATNSTYALTSGDVGTAISVRVSYTDGQGTAETLTSSATSSVQNVNDSPTGLASISGIAAEG
ncbi:hypothetical protein PQY68_06050, partial [Planktomarina temperata]|nr:hypothetical protein [Planktomarina temperata]